MEGEKRGFSDHFVGGVDPEVRDLRSPDLKPSLAAPLLRPVLVGVDRQGIDPRLCELEAFDLLLLPCVYDYCVLYSCLDVEKGMELHCNFVEICVCGAEIAVDRGVAVLFGVDPVATLQLISKLDTLIKHKFEVIVFCEGVGHVMPDNHMDPKLPAIVFVEPLFQLKPAQILPKRRQNIIHGVGRRVVGINILIDECQGIPRNIIRHHINRITIDSRVEYAEEVNRDGRQLIDRIEIGEMEGLVSVDPLAVHVRLVGVLPLHRLPHSAVRLKALKPSAKVLIELYHNLASIRNVVAILKRDLKRLSVVLSQDPAIVVVNCLEIDAEDSPEHRWHCRREASTYDLILVRVHYRACKRFRVRVRRCS